MTREEVRDRVMEIVAEQFGVERSTITPDTNFINDLSSDSLDLIELVMELEDEFDVAVTDEDAERLYNVDHAVQFIWSQLSQVIE
jgi:acyl carrier protein